MGGQIIQAVHCIGFAPWGRPRQQTQARRRPQRLGRAHREEQYHYYSFLMAELLQKLKLADYHVDPCVRTGEPICLNPNHSEFLLIDDGYADTAALGRRSDLNKWAAGRPSKRIFASISIARPFSLFSDLTQDPTRSLSACTKLRYGLEKLISRHPEEGGLDIPVIYLLVEGEYKDLLHLLLGLRNGSSAVVCARTGRAADLIANCLLDKQQGAGSGEAVAKRAEAFEPGKSPEARDQIVKTLREILTYSEQAGRL